jgi:hypothetical protein
LWESTKAENSPILLSAVFERRSRETTRVDDSNKEFNQQGKRQTRTIIRLTWAILVLTGAMTAGLAVQIWLALHAR